MTELSIIFNENQYILKNEGDIFFWNHLINTFDKRDDSINHEDFVNIISQEFLKITGEPLTIFARGKIKNKNLFINSKFWIDNFIHTVSLKKE